MNARIENIEAYVDAVRAPLLELLAELLLAYDADAGEPPPERQDLIARCRKEVAS